MLSDINLHQFKRFKDESVELFPLTLMTGINGMGKSSVIQSLLILRQSFDRGELQNNNRLVIEDKELVNLVSPDDMLCSDADDKKVSIELIDENKNAAKWVVVAEGQSNILQYKYERKDGDIYSCSLFDKEFQYLNAERIGPRVTYNKLTITKPHSPIGYKGEFVANRILEAASNLEEVKLKEVLIDGVSAKVYDQLSAWVSEIIYLGTKVSIDDSDDSKISLQYSFRDEQTKTFNPLNIGFGFSFALPVILAILTAKPGSLMIIENPEAHLHPRGQSRMGRLIGLAVQSGVQIIVETHSDHLLNGIRVAVKQGKLDCNKTHIHYFTADKVELKNLKYKISFAIDEDGGLERWPSGFFDEWDNMLDELLKDK
ncbi:MAG: DUF3696 domain-containing protein [Chitinophagaceae bacterium]|nr:DUF3696 domain-containing protein [Chitinophagaceae bacterium]